MSELFNREISVQVGTTLIESRSGDDDVPKSTLRITFKVEQAIKAEPNTVEVKIWNLAEKTRAKFQDEKIPVVVEAGYVGNSSRIFSGDLSYGSSVHSGTEWITSFQAGDGEGAFRANRINDSIKAGTKVREVMKKALGKLDLGAGNILKKIDEGDFRGALEEFSNGAVLSGNAAGIVDNLAKTLGFEFQIRDGSPEILRVDETTEDEAISLSTGTGLIGSPEEGGKGFIRARSLLQAGLYPGRKVEIISSGIDAFFKVRSAIHTGDTWGPDWYSDIEAAPL